MVVDRYFVVTPTQYANHTALLIPDEDVLPLDKFVNAAPLWQDSEKVILLVRLGQEDINSLAAQVDLPDSLTYEAVSVLGITTAYLGTSEEDVFVRYPELALLDVVGEDDSGEPLLKRRLKSMVWA